MRGFKPGLYALVALMLAGGACSAAESEAVATPGVTPMSDTPTPTDQEMPTVSPETVSGLWALHASDRPDAPACRIALQKVEKNGIYGVYLEGCEGTILARVSGWRVLDGAVALLDAGGEPVIRFRKTAMDRLESSAGGVTYRLEPAAM